MSSSRSTVSLTWSLSSIQREYFDSDAKYRTLVAGRRFGKNTVGLASQIDFAARPHAYQYGRDSDVVTWWIAPTYNQAKKYGFETALEMLPDRLLDGDPKQTIPFEINLATGSTMEFYSFDRPKSLDGAGVDDMVIDERGYMDDSIWHTNLAPMLLDTGGRASFIGKPWSSDHFRESFDKGQDPAHPEYASWQATSYDNPWIPDERIDELFGDLPDRIYQREIMADFDASGTVLTDDMLNYIAPEELPDTEPKWIVGVDLGVTADSKKAREDDTDYWTAAVLGVDTIRSKGYLFHVHRKRGMTLREGLDWLQGITRPLRSPSIYVESNQAQRWFAQEAAERGLNVAQVQNTTAKEDRIVQLSIPFEAGTILLVDTGEWSDFTSEWLSFPDGKHDDQLDATEIAVSNCQLTSNTGMYGANPYDNEG